MERIDELKRQFLQELADATDVAAIELLKVKYLGKKGPIQDLMRSIISISQEERKAFGKEVNLVKQSIEAELDKKYHLLFSKEEDLRLKNESIDITLPGRRKWVGSQHILSKTLQEILDILIGMGFSVQYGPDLDSDYFNFEALNFSKDHPARDMQDTFYISDSMLLRTHTSNVQIRVMESSTPPIRVVAPGKVYRNETITARSHVFFHQVEGFYIDQGVTFSDLLSTLEEFLKKLFSEDVKMRCRPSYFPFVEPGLEVDVSCLNCSGVGCSICKHTGWLEIAGAGMIHPEVLKNGNIDPEKYTGYAWGIGVERIAMLKSGVQDIRLFTENDVRFLSQFSAV